jgi:hypothetical protein
VFSTCRVVVTLKSSWCMSSFMGKGVAGSLARLRVRWDCHLREVLALEVLHSCN